LRGAITTSANMGLTFVGAILPAQQQGAGFCLLLLARRRPFLWIQA
jgi:hypothetical protein